MAKKSVSFSMLNVSATVDGRAVRGFFDGDDVVQVAEVNDVATMAVGADGWGITSLNADKSVNITLRLQISSPTNSQLENLLAQQRKTNRSVMFPVQVINTDTNEGGNTAEASIRTHPSVTYGRNASVREWVLQAIDWDWSDPDATLLPA